MSVVLSVGQGPKTKHLNADIRLLVACLWSPLYHKARLIITDRAALGDNLTSLTYAKSFTKLGNDAYIILLWNECTLNWTTARCYLYINKYIVKIIGCGRELSGGQI